MPQKRVVVLHGYLASADDHWFYWLRRELKPQGVAVDIPNLPESKSPDPERWTDAALAAIEVPDENTVVVGHSLGCITALRALDRISDPWSLGGLVLVAGFDQELDLIPELAPFTVARPDYARIVERTAHRVVVASDDDPVVPPSLSEAVAESLEATLYTVPGAGHFLASEGFVELPLVANQVLAAFGLARPETAA